MKRLVVTNSALAYPRVPDSVLRPGDEVLPLVERFEEALFMPSRLYAGVQAAITDVNRQARELARQMAEVLPAELADAPSERGHSAWDVLEGTLVRYTLGPLLVNQQVLAEAIREAPREVLAFAGPRSHGWWSGRHMVEEAARHAAAATGARLFTSAAGGGAVRRLRAAMAPLTALAAGRSELRGRRPAGARSQIDPCDVLFAVAGPTLRAPFELIAAELEDAHDIRVGVVEAPLAAGDRGIVGASWPAVRLYDVGDASLARDAFRDMRRARGWQRSVARVLGGFHPLASLGPHLLAVLRLRLHFVLGELAPMAIYHAKLWRLLLDMARPRALVSFNSSNDMIAPGILQAGPRGIATICCQHGVWGPYRLAGHLSPFDEVLVFGDYAREILGTIAEPQTRFTVTGHSVYDARAGDLPDGQRPVGQPPVVLATTQPVERHLSTGEACWWLDEVARGCAEAGAALWIKPHPEERDLSQYEDLARRMPETAVLVRHGERPLDDMIAACDLLVTRFSTTAMEANLQGVPVMTVNPAGGRDWYPYAEDGGGVGAHSCAEIAPLVVRALTDPQLRADLAASRAGFIERHLGRVDGHATERIAARIAARIARQS